jgi:fructose-bisphosphate aldolase class I
MDEKKREQMGSGQGFVAALDQSGGSTPKALGLYGIEESEYSGEQEMYDRIHEMRTRIVTSPAFSGERILAAILFEQTMDRTIEDLGSAEYLWQKKHVVPILKVDKGLADEDDGAQLMKPMPQLDDLLSRAREHGVFGTKMRSVIKRGDRRGVDAVVEQQFDVDRRIIAGGLVPIIEPEVDIHAPDKPAVEGLLRDALAQHLDALGEDEVVMLKLTLPDEDDFYVPLIEHPRVLRVVALSGGYSREEADEKLTRNHGLIASFSRALTEGLTAQMSDEEFDAALGVSIEEIYRASIT